MAAVVFFEKPGCATNARQKRALRDAGHDLRVRSILSEPWSVDRLRSFFGSDPVETWFNPAAPRIKSGEIVPFEQTATEALSLMIRDPLLIRRPLIETEGQRCAGFSREPVLSLLGGNDHDTEKDLEGCRRLSTGGHCPEPKESGALEPS